MLYLRNRTTIYKSTRICKRCCYERRTCINVLILLLQIAKRCNNIDILQGVMQFSRYFKENFMTMRKIFINKCEALYNSQLFFVMKSGCRRMERARQRTETAIDSPFGRNVNRQVVLPNRKHFMLVESLAQYFSHVPLFNDIQYAIRHTYYTTD